MGSHERSLVSAEEVFARRLRSERERRGWSQAEVAQKLLDQSGIKLHATAIAKMEQRASEHPRTIRLEEATAIAKLFDLTVNDMTSPGGEFETLRKKAAHISSLMEETNARYMEIFGALQQHRNTILHRFTDLPPAAADALARTLKELATHFNPSPAWYAGALLDREFSAFIIPLLAGIAEDQRDRTMEKAGITTPPPRFSRDQSEVSFQSEKKIAMEGDARRGLRARESIEAKISEVVKESRDQ